MGIAKLLETIAFHRPLRVIDHNGRQYLRRYFLCKIGQWHFYLHKFVGDDPAGLHNHPFKLAVSLILSHWYIEETRWGKRPIKWFNILWKDTMHRVLLPGHAIVNNVRIPCWTLFIHTRKETRWGTIVDKGSFKQFVEGGTGEAREWWKNAESEKEIFTAFCAVTTGPKEPPSHSQE